MWRGPDLSTNGLLLLKVYSPGGRASTLSTAMTSGEAYRRGALPPRRKDVSPSVHDQLARLHERPDCIRKVGPHLSNRGLSLLWRSVHELRQHRRRGLHHHRGESIRVPDKEHQAIVNLET